MKIVIEPARFRRLLENVLLYHGGAELDSALGAFGPGKVEFKSVGLEVIWSYAAYGKDFFLEYEAGEEQVPLSKSLLEQMREGFNGKQMDVYTEGDKVHLEVPGDHYEEPMIEMEPGEFPVKFVADKKLGLVPESLKAEVQVLVKADTLTGLPKAKDYLFVSDGEKLEVIVEDVGKRTKEIKASKVGVLNEGEFKFDAGYFGKVANQFTGEVWLTLRQDATVFSQKSKDHMLTYLLSGV